MIVTVFRSRLNPEAAEEYGRWAEHIATLARSMPGYISHKGFTAQDGERVTLVEFEGEEHVRAWAAHPVHLEAMSLGRKGFYTEYRIQVCSVLRQSAFQSDPNLSAF